MDGPSTFWGKKTVADIRNLGTALFSWLTDQVENAVAEQKAENGAAPPRGTVEDAQQKTIDVAGRDIKVGVQPQVLDAMARMIPLGRGGTPEEAADAVYLFCSPESNYISGQVVVCGGGLII